MIGDKDGRHEYLIHDRDRIFAQHLDDSIRALGVEVLRSPIASPKANANAERFVRSIKDKCLSRVIFIGQASLRRAVAEYVEHYQSERNHQGLADRLVRLPTAAFATSGAVGRRPRLGGTLNFYYREAA